MFFYELAILCGLIALALVYYEVGAVKDLVPIRFQRLPVEAAWFGALGGVAIARADDRVGNLPGDHL